MFQSAQTGRGCCSHQRPEVEVRLQQTGEHQLVVSDLRGIQTIRWTTPPTTSLMLLCPALMSSLDPQ